MPLSQITLDEPAKGICLPAFLARASVNIPFPGSSTCDVWTIEAKNLCLETRQGPEHSQLWHIDACERTTDLGLVSCYFDQKAEQAVPTNKLRLCVATAAGRACAAAVPARAALSEGS